MERLTRIVLLSACALSAGCRRVPPEGDGPYAHEVASAIPRIERAMGVKFKTPPRVETRTRAQVREFVTREFERAEPRQDIAGEQAAYKVLGLIPADMDLTKFLTDLLTEQVIGYYDPATKVLYVVENAPEDVVGVTITHELVHALQDQYFNLDSLHRVRGDDDRQAAAQAIIEGGATFEQLSAMTGGEAITARLPGGWERIREAIRDAQSSQPIFSSAPMVIQETLLFPYINGADFVRRFKEHRPGELPLHDLPVSTEQVMHDSAFFGPHRDDPTRVTLPRVTGSIYENDLGEFGTRLFLYQHLSDENAAIRGAKGWDGDRYVVAHAAGGDAVAWVSVWDDAVEAAEFVSALTDATSRRYKVPVRTDATGRTFTGASRTARITARVIDGRNVVMYVDVPAGASPTLLDLAAVKIGG